MFGVFTLSVRAKWVVSHFLFFYFLFFGVFSEVSWTGATTHSGALVTDTCLLYQWSCASDGAAPEVPLSTSLNAEVQVSLDTLRT